MTSNPGTQRLALALAAVALLAVAAMLAFWASEGSEPDLDGEPDLGSSHVAAGVSATESVSRPEGGTVDAGSVRSDLSGTVEAAAEPKPEERTRHHVQVRVLDARTGEPVADADVVADPFVEGPLPLERQLAVVRTVDRLELNLASGEVTKTDAEGMAFVKVRSGAAIDARKGELTGTARANFDKLGPEGLVIRLRAERRVGVTVVDVDGKPCQDVPILMQVSWSAEAERNEHWSLGWTQADGSIRTRIEESLSGRSWPTTAEVYVALPGLVHVRAPVGRDLEPVRLQLPPCGALVVRAIGADGQPLADLPGWYAQVTGGGSAGEGQARGETRSMDYGQGGEVRFAHIGLGVRLTVNAAVDAAERMQVRMPGPVRAGEEVVHVFDLRQKPGFACRGRLLLADGTPLASARAFFRESASGGQVEVLTDAEGRFSTRVRRYDESPVARVEPWAMKPDRSPCWFPPFDLRRGVLRDVGDLIAQDSMLVATGEIVTDGALPLGLHLQVREGPKSHQGPYSSEVHGDGTFQIWRLHGEPVLPLTLTASAPGWSTVPPMPVAVGDRLRVEMHRGVYFRARIAVDPAVLGYVQQTSLDMVMTHETQGGTLVRGVLTDGEFVFESATLAEGMYEVAVESGNATDDLAQMSAVRLAPGVPTDPRLQPWDLRSAVQLRTVRLRKSDGSLLPVGGQMERRRAADGEWESCPGFEGGVGRMLTTMVPSDLLLTIEGHGPFLRQQVMGDLDLVVPEPHRFRLVLDGLPALHGEAPFRIQVRAGPEWARARGMPEHVSPVVDSSWKRDEGVVEVVVADPVEVELVITMRQTNQHRELLRKRVQPTAGQGEVHVQLPEDVLAPMRSYAVPAGAPR